MSVRLAVRALILRENKLLLVNAYADAASDIWCAPGGGVEAHSSLPENLQREVYEETGLTISVGAPVLINEFHSLERDFHQAEVFFRAEIIDGTLDENWADPEGVVTKRQFFARPDLDDIRARPAGLAAAVWGDGMRYDPLEPMLR
ncbi:MAG: NUDIX hydrolase [Pseudomonadota bacterium]